MKTIIITTLCTIYMYPGNEGIHIFCLSCRSEAIGMADLGSTVPNVLKS